MDADALKEIVNYDPETGEFRWRETTSNKAKAGDLCGCKTKAGYVVLRIRGKLYQANRMAWLYQTGSLPNTLLKFKNGDVSDNRIANLEESGIAIKTRKKREAFKERISRDVWLQRFAAKHGATYDYSRAEIDGATTKITILCGKHGPFEQTPVSHASGNGCRKCADESNGLRFRHTIDSVIARFREVHGDTYDYSTVEGEMASGKVTITCKTHGPFEQYAFDHLRGCGCPRCVYARAGDRSRKPWDSILPEFTRMHGDRYEYDVQSYRSAKAKMRIICPEHGPFLQVAADHANGCGCPRCIDMTNPKPNRELTAFIEDLGFAVEREAKIFGDRRAGDVVVPSVKLLIEHNGAWWHSEKYLVDARTRLAKRLADAKALGYRCLFFFDDEWMRRKSQCKNMIRHALGMTEKLHARECSFELRPAGDAEAAAFLDEHHIQGHTPCALYGVLRHNGRIVMAASFGALRSNRGNTDMGRWELSRMASCASVRGGASKIMRNLLLARPDICDVTTYYDHRLFNGGGVYEKMGFKPVKTYGPDYTYVNWNRRYHKSQFQKALIQKRFSIDMSDKTESEAMNSVGYFRVWDCGKTRYEFKR